MISTMMAKSKAVIKSFFRRSFLRGLLRRVYLRKGMEFPSMVQIEITNYCNARCIMCPHDKLSREIGHIDQRLFTKLIDECARNRRYVKSVLPNHFGEPFLNPLLPEYIRYAKQKVPKSEICIFTNGSLLNEENARKILESGLDVITVSFDGFSKQTYERIRRQLNFDDVNKNIMRLLDLKKTLKKNKPRIELAYVEIEENKAETEAFIKKWQGIIDKVHIGFFCNWGGAVEGEEVIGTRQLNFKRKPCTRLWSHLLVFRNGDVPLCCQDFNGDYILGNANQASIKEIWEGITINRYRQLHLAGKFGQIPICKICNFWKQQGEPIWWW